jgi:hypothetical protein
MASDATDVALTTERRERLQAMASDATDVALGGVQNFEPKTYRHRKICLKCCDAANDV